MSGRSKKQNTPKSIRQKRILNIAADRPDASLEQIASEVATATPDVVERVLEQYGDPAEQTPANGHGTNTGQPTTSDGGNPVSEAGQPSAGHPDPESKEPSGPEPPDVGSESEPDPAESDVATDDSVPAFESLTPKQRETLVAVREHPEATQRELAETLGVSAPTVSNRLNAISGFEWDDRLPFVNVALESADADVIAELESSIRASDGTDSDAGDTSEDREKTEAAAVSESGAAGNPDSDSGSETTDGSVSGTGTAPDGGTERADTETAGEVAAIQAERLNELIASIEELHDQLAADDDSSEGPFDPELTSKIIHACMETENISENEELEIIKQLT